MIELLLGTIALEPNRWTKEKKPHYRLIDLVDRAGTYGFTGFEVWQYHLAHATVDHVERLASRVADANLSLPVLALYPTIRLPRVDAEVEMADLLKLARRSRKLGTRALKIFVGDRGSDEVTADEYDRSIAFLKRLVDRAAGLGLRVLGETHPDTLFDSVESCLATIDAVGEGLGVCFQPYDFADTGRAVADLRRLAGRVEHVHLQGRQGTTLSTLEVADIHYADVIDVLAELGYDGDLCIEFVEGCVVQGPEEFDIDAVLVAARADREFLARVASDAGLAITR